MPDFSPLDGATVADPATNITLTFNEPVKKNARGSDFASTDLSAILTLKKTDSGGADIAYAASIDTAKKVITIDPAANLEGGAVYVGISNAFYDAFGNQGQAASATYTVRSTVPTRLQVTAGNAKLALEWTAPTVALTGYDVHYTSAPKSGTGMVADSATVQAGSEPSHADGWVDAEHTGTGASQDITGLTNGAEYRVRVRAKNGNSPGEWVFGAATPEIRRRDAERAGGDGQRERGRRVHGAGAEAGLRGGHDRVRGDGGGCGHAREADADGHGLRCQRHGRG